MNIFLIGAMGAGKTTIGRQLAKELGREFYDSDKEVERRTGTDIAWIFDREGEAGFRKREQRVIAELTQLQGIVLATGGGVVLSADNRSALKAGGRIIYLEVSRQQQVSRIERDKERRPLANSANILATLEQLQAPRYALYQTLADWTFNTDNLSVRAVVQSILAKLREIGVAENN